MDLIIKDTKADFNEYFDICNASDETKEKFETKDFFILSKLPFFISKPIFFLMYISILSI